MGEGSGSFPKQQPQSYQAVCWLHLTDVLMRHVLIAGLSLTLDQDKQMALRFDDEMLDAVGVSTHT